MTKVLLLCKILKYLGIVFQQVGEIPEHHAVLWEQLIEHLTRDVQVPKPSPLPTPEPGAVISASVVVLPVPPSK